MFKRYRMLIFHFIFILFALNSSSTYCQSEDFNILNKWVRWSNSGNMVINHLNDQAFHYLDLRGNGIAALKTEIDWKKRQEIVKAKLMKSVGPFPGKTPLNPIITGVLKKNGYRVEKIIYESVPKFYVTACLFIPDRIKGKGPVVIHVSGHTWNAFRDSTYQIVIQNLVKKGFIVFAIDPIAQGERDQYFDSVENKSIIENGVPSHSYVGNQCFISGSSIAKYFTWDIIRGIDYLETRKEVDMKNIGIAGRSGGGTQSAYAVAFDDRIKASAPEAFITSQKRLLESVGLQDAEANLYHAVINGIEHADFIEVRAPKPMMILTTSRDFFSIQGARETYQEALKAYQAFGKPGNLILAQDDYIHGSTKKNREAVYGFFQKFLEHPGNPVEDEVEILNPEDLKVTSTGKVSSSLGGETVFTLNVKHTEELLHALENSRRHMQEHLKMVREKAKSISGFIFPAHESEPVFCGRYTRKGYSVEMYVLQGEGTCAIPLLLFVPDSCKKSPAIIYLNPEGKSADASPGGKIEQLVNKGIIVAAPDLAGIGETKNTGGRYEHAVDYATVLIGRSLPGIRAGDIIRVSEFLKYRADVNASEIGTVATGELCPALLHALAFDQSIKYAILRQSPVSYRSVVMNRFYKVNFSCSVPGALMAYDLPDLIGCISPRKVILEDIKDQMLEPATPELISRELEFPRKVYSSEKVKENLRIVTSDSSLDSIVDWCLK